VCLREALWEGKSLLVCLYEREKDIARRLRGALWEGKIPLGLPLRKGERYNKAFKRGEAPLFFFPLPLVKEGGYRGMDFIKG
jgi:hypothetical protein